jgi:POT family proton-dependent oligopeptide transporter
MNQTATKKMPKGVGYIVGNEAAERFSYYGMRTILVVFMTQYLLGANGLLDPMTKPEAMVWYHNFNTAVYFFPLIGALIADIFWGKYKTILILSIVYCFGHLALALDETRLGLMWGLSLIAIGSGGIKPAVGAHVGDQFSEGNKDLIQKVFGWFYFAINFGAFLSSLATPWLLNIYGPAVAFGIPGVLMLLATIIFFMGRKVFVAIPPVGWKRYRESLIQGGDFKALLKLCYIYVFIAFFWSLYDQSSSAWVLQAQQMNRMVDWGFVSFEVLPSQVQAVNPIMILLFIPLCDKFLYPAINRVFTLTPIRKIGIGLFLTASSFVVTALAQELIEAGQDVTMMWQVWAYVLLTLGEVMVSITGLEMSYTHAPHSMKSFVMGLFYLSVAIGNQFTSLVNVFIQNPDGTSKLSESEYYWFFTILMAVIAVIYTYASRFYNGQVYINSDEEALVHTEAVAEASAEAAN